MGLRSFVTAVFGVGMAGGAVFLADGYLGEQANATAVPTDPDMVQIVVARKIIDFGQPLVPAALTTQPWPASAVPVGAFTAIQDLVGSDPSQSRRALGRVFQGEVILASKLSTAGARVTIVQKLGENSRAMAIKVDAVTAVGGFVTPGDYVDIVLTQGGGDGMRAGTILQKIRVIGVDQQSEENAEQPVIARTVTVEVTPDQGQRLALAQRAGTLSLTLRTLKSGEDQNLKLVQLQDLFDGPPTVVVGKTPTVVRKTSITIRRGTDSETVQLR